MKIENEEPVCINFRRKLRFYLYIVHMDIVRKLERSAFYHTSTFLLIASMSYYSKAIC